MSEKKAVQPVISADLLLDEYSVTLELADITVLTRLLEKAINDSTFATRPLLEALQQKLNQVL